eukprot:9301430-Pyramimonas_sp.AAC.1
MWCLAGHGPVDLRHTSPALHDEGTAFGPDQDHRGLSADLPADGDRAGMAANAEGGEAPPPGGRVQQGQKETSM